MDDHIRPPLSSRLRQRIRIADTSDRVLVACWAMVALVGLAKLGGVL